MHNITDTPLYITNFSQLQVLKYRDHAAEILDLANIDQVFVFSNTKGLEMFHERFVQDVKFEEVMKNGTKVYSIAAVVKAMMKQSVKYDVYVDIREADGKILTGWCECPAGGEPAICKHFFAVTALLVDYAQKELYNAPTEQLQRWHRPQKKKFSPTKAEDAFEAKSESPKSLSLNLEALKLLPKNLGIFHVIKFSEELEYSSSISLPAIPFGGQASFAPERLTLGEILFLNDLALSVDDCVELEKRTMQQSTNSLWRTERKKRVTASNFYRISSRRGHFEELAAQILIDRDLSNVAAVQWGIRMEPIVRNKLRNLFPLTGIRRVGLIVNPVFPFVGCSPDGLICSKEEPILIEIKTVFNVKKESLDELAERRQNFCLEKVDGIFRLKKNHPYMCQIQAQMGISNLKKCLFVLHYNPKDLFLETITFSSQNFDDMMKKVSDFYFTYYLKLLLK